MKYNKKIIIVGAGMSGLTAGAYLLSFGYDVTILEQNSICGGLVSSFEKEGFTFDTGPRAIGNGGILLPMLNDLNIDLPLVKGEVSTGIKDHIIHYESRNNIDSFILSLQDLFPDELDAIQAIDKHIRVYSRMAEWLNKIPNPFFKQVFKDKEYFFKEFLPWIPSFLSVLFRTSLFNKPIEDFLLEITNNRSLVDMISQHFFKGMPTNFALGYFENFQDYLYPLGGTKNIPQALVEKIKEKGGLIALNSEILVVDPINKRLTDQNRKEYYYDKLLWAADLKSFYRMIDCKNCSTRVHKIIIKERNKFLSAKSGESVFSIFIAVDDNPEFFRKISKGHFIYTPHLKGLGDLHREQLDNIKATFSDITKDELFNWLREFCLHNSYEISIPVLKDETLAPENKTGLIISVLFDGELVQLIKIRGFYDDFRKNMIEYMIETLDNSIYRGFKNKILFTESVTPLTLMDMFHTDKGAITGWSLEKKVPVPHSLSRILGSVKSKIPNVFIAGQWSYSPSGVPVAILTGRIAARQIKKELN